MKILLIITILLFCKEAVSAQEFYSRTAHVHLKSNNKIKDIEADNFQVISYLSTEEGTISFEGLLRSFEFRLGALDRVFTAKTIDFSQYPSIKFEGKISPDLDRLSTGRHKVKVTGVLYIWDEKRITETEAYIHVLPDGKLEGRADFILTIEEKSVQKLNRLIQEKLPKALNINMSSFGVSRDIKVTLDVTYKSKNW